MIKSITIFTPDSGKDIYEIGYAPKGTSIEYEVTNIHATSSEISIFLGKNNPPIQITYWGNYHYVTMNTIENS